MLPARPHKVTPTTVTAIAARGGMRRGGAVKKMAGGGATKKMPMPGDSVASGNRMSKMEADERRFMDSQKPLNTVMG